MLLSLALTSGLAAVIQNPEQQSPQQALLRDGPWTVDLTIDAGDDCSELANPWPLGVGVPLPQGATAMKNRIRVLSSLGDEIDCQVAVRSRWWDDSIQWVWVDFVSDPCDSYVLEVVPSSFALVPPTGGEPMVTCDATSITVDAGTLLVEWDLSLATPVAVEVSGSTMLTGDGLGAYIRDMSFDGSPNHEPHTLGGNGADLEWVVEDSGPIRSTVSVEGWFSNSTSQIARGKLRYHVYRDLPYLFVEHTLILTEETHVEGFYLTEVGLDFPLPGQGEVFSQYAWEGASGSSNTWNSTSPNVWVAQEEYPHLDVDVSTMSCGSDDFSTIKSGTVDGWFSAYREGQRTTVSVRDFAQQYPKEIRLDASEGTVSALLWSPRGGDLDYHLDALDQTFWNGLFCLPGECSDDEDDEGDPGQVIPGPNYDAGFSAYGSARTHELLVAYEPVGEGVSEAALHATFQHRPLGLADPAWLMGSGALWPMHAKDENFETAESFIRDSFDEWLERGKDAPWTGWFGWGMGPSFRYVGGVPDEYRLNANAGYNIPKYLWGAWARSGDRDYFDVASRLTRHIADFEIIHYGEGPGTNAAKKRRGLITDHTIKSPPTPWSYNVSAASGGHWDVNYQTDYIAPMWLGYFLADLRYAKDAAVRFSEAVREIELFPTHEPGDPEPKLEGKDLFPALSQMMSAYRVTGDAALEEKIHSFVTKAVDTNQLLGITIEEFDPATGEGFWQNNGQATNGLGIPAWSQYKFDHKIQALTEYADLFEGHPDGLADLARSAVLKATGFATQQDESQHGTLTWSSFRDPFATQNQSPLLAARAWQWEGESTFKRVALAHYESALTWYRDVYLPLQDTPDAPNVDSYFGHTQQTFAQFGLPHVLSILEPDDLPKLDSEDDVTISPSKTFPILALLGREEPAEILFEKDEGAAARLVVSFQDLAHEPGYPPTLEVEGPAGPVRTTITPWEELVLLDTSETTRHTLALEVDSDEPPGVYKLSVPAADLTNGMQPGISHRFQVLESTSEKVSVHLPEGGHLGHLEQAGFALTRGNRYYFEVPTGVVTLEVNPLNLPRSNTVPRIWDAGEAGTELWQGQEGIHTLTGNPGTWSIDPGRAVFVRVHDGAKPVFALGSEQRLLTGNVDEADWTPPLVFEGGLPETAGDVSLGEGLGGTGAIVLPAQEGNTVGKQAAEANPDFPLPPTGTFEFFFRRSKDNHWKLTCYRVANLKLEGSSKTGSSCGGGTPGSDFLELRYKYRPQESGSQEFLSQFEVDFRPHGSVCGTQDPCSTLHAFGSWAADEWHHLAITWNTPIARYRIFVDGHLLDEVDGVDVDLDPLDLRALQLWGQVATVAFDDVRLSSAERYSTDFEVPVGGYVDDPSTTLLYYPFDADGCDSVSQMPPAYCFEPSDD